jgi:hypothetical protein
VNGIGKGGIDVGREYERSGVRWASRKKIIVVILSVGED